MSILNQEETRKAYLNRFDKFNSKELNRKALIHFDNFLSLKKLTEQTYIDSLKNLGQDPNLYLSLGQIAEHLQNNGLHPRSIRSYFTAIKLYLRFKGLRIYNEDIKTYIKFPRILKEAKIPLDKQTIQKLLDHADNYLKFVILGLISSGMRASELLQLTFSDLSYPYVNVRAETTKTGVERKTFFSPQVWELINLLKSQADSDDYVFCSSYEGKESLDLLETRFSTLRHRAGLETKYRNSNLHTITLHRFRAFCKTQASEVCNKDFAEGLIGHEGYLGTYNALSDQEKLNNYLKLEQRLKFRL